MAGEVQGLEQIQAAFRRLAGTVSKRAMRSAVNAGMTPVTKALRAAVNATSGASPALKREARKTIGKRIKQRGGQPTAKAGFAVGKKREGEPKDRGGKKGVGVGVRNIHWFALGTKQRRLKKGSRRGPKAGHPTGAIEPVFAGKLAQAVSVSQPAMIEAARKKLAQVLMKEATRKG